MKRLRSDKRGSSAVDIILIIVVLYVFIYYIMPYLSQIPPYPQPYPTQPTQPYYPPQPTQWTPTPPPTIWTPPITTPTTIWTPPTTIPPTTTTITTIPPPTTTIGTPSISVDEIWFDTIATPDDKYYKGEIIHIPDMSVVAYHVKVCGDFYEGTVYVEIVKDFAEWWDSPLRKDPHTVSLHNGGCEWLSDRWVFTDEWRLRSYFVKVYDQNGKCIAHCWYEDPWTRPSVWVQGKIIFGE